MLKKILIYTGLTILVILIIGGLYYFHRAPRLSNRLIMFYSDRCPHCQIVESFLSSNQVMTKLPLEKRSIENNIQQIVTVAKICKLDLQRLQIPLLWTGSGCIIGDKPIINYFKTAMEKQ